MSETKREWDTMNIATLPYVYIVEIKTQGKYKSYYSHEQINQRIPQLKGCAFRSYKYSIAHNGRSFFLQHSHMNFFATGNISFAMSPLRYCNSSPKGSMRKAEAICFAKWPFSWS